MLDDNTKYLGLLWYERLVDICYRCGQIGHTSYVCDFPVAPLNPDDIPYGEWILVSTDTSQILANYFLNK